MESSNSLKANPSTSSTHNKIKEDHSLGRSHMILCFISISIRISKGTRNIWVRICIIRVRDLLHMLLGRSHKLCINLRSRIIIIYFMGKIWRSLWITVYLLRKLWIIIQSKERNFITNISTLKTYNINPHPIPQRPHPWSTPKPQ